MKIIRVFVADDHVYAVPGLRAIIGDTHDMEIVGSTSTLLNILVKAKEAQPNVIVLDMAWPGDKLAGAKLIPELRMALSGTRIVAITVYPELLELAQSGGAFPLSKGFSKQELLDTIRWAMTAEGKPADSPEPRDFEPLTNRERETLSKIVMGMTDKKIAFALGIAEGTVKKHVGSILSKLGVASRTEAAIFAERHRLL